MRHTGPTWGVFTAALVALGAALQLTMPAHALAQSNPDMWMWGDASGVLHQAARIGDLPEPFLTLYRDQERQKRRVIRVTGAQPLPRTDADAAKKVWQDRVVAARSALLAATLAYAAQSERMGTLQSNPILRLTPSVQAEIAAGAQSLIDARSRFLAARKFLVDTLPDQARKQQVPPMWLNP